MGQTRCNRPFTSPANDLFLHVELDSLAIIQVLQGDVVGDDRVLSSASSSSRASRTSGPKIEAERCTREELVEYVRPREFGAAATSSTGHALEADLVINLPCL
jgi:uncharacterized protein (DUF362 family)